MLLREQMAAIRKELGEDGTEQSWREYRTKIAEQGCPMTFARQADPPSSAGSSVRLERSPEYGWIAHYLDWLLDVPWSAKNR